MAGQAKGFSQQRMQEVLSTTHQAFPLIPSTVDEMISTGVVTRPTFFGCFPLQNPPEFPLLLYFPNAPPLDGSDPVTKYVLLKSSNNNNLPLRKLALIPSSSRTPTSLLLSSWIRFMR